MQKDLTDFIKKDRVFGKYNYSATLQNLAKLDWFKEPFAAQNWGIWLHRMAPYQGKVKPAEANRIIAHCSQRGDFILDPFCGCGTILLEAELLGRRAIGNDLNPYAFALSRAKFDRHPAISLIEWINRTAKEDTGNSDITWLDPEFECFYDPATLREISHFRQAIIKDNQSFIQGCLLGILHGHRPKHLSAITSLVIPYKPKTPPIYKDVRKLLLYKIRRMYRNLFPARTGVKVLNEDSRILLSLRDNSIDCIITSPPYYDTLDYVESNRLRLNYLGYKGDQRKELKQSLIQTFDSYLGDMKLVGMSLRRVLKPDRPCVLILGDHSRGKQQVNTAAEIERILVDIGFHAWGSCAYQMPTNKCVPTKKKRNKMERILVLENIK